MAFVVVACGGKSIGSDDIGTSRDGGSSGSTSGGTGGGSSGSSGSSGGGSCEGGSLFDYCGADGFIQQQCCPANAHCSPPASYCKLPGGRCRIGDCAPTPCGDTSCTGDDVCVVTSSGGGACLQPDDNGLCPDGQPANGACCNRTTTTYECKPMPASCGSTLACPCAASLCECGGCQLGGTNTLTCGCFYP